MPIGFPAYAERSIRYRGVTRKEMVDATEDALDSLGWHPLRQGKGRFRASVPSEFYFILVTWGARLSVEIDQNELFIRSEGTVALAWFDFGQHDRNIGRFLNRFEEILDYEE